MGELHTISAYSFSETFNAMIVLWLKFLLHVFLLHISSATSPLPHNTDVHTKNMHAYRMQGHTNALDVHVIVWTHRQWMRQSYRGVHEWHRPALAWKTSLGAEQRSENEPICFPMPGQWAYRKTKRRTQTNTHRHTGGVSHENSGHPSLNVLNRQERDKRKASGGKAGGGREKGRRLREARGI